MGGAGGAEDSARLGRGATVGRYILLDRIGEGGVGEVYSAYDPELDRKVAVKLLRHEDGAAGEMQERLLREAQAMARVSHANVIPIYDVGISAGRVFLTMEFVQGQTLRQWRKEKRPSWREVLSVYVAAGRGLAAAHDAGLVHRDFKPDNVLVAADGSVKVMDFGIARALHDGPEVRVSTAGVRAVTPAPTEPSPPTVRLPVAFVEAPKDEPPLVSSLGPVDGAPVEGAPLDGSPLERTESIPKERDSEARLRVSRPPLSFPLTCEGVILGTPGYMAPEQYRAEPPDPRTDQFSFCVALYEALYGERPFAGVTLSEVQKAVAFGRVRPAPRGTGVPPWVRKVLLRGLSVERDARYPTMDALLQALSRDMTARRFRLFAVVAVSVAAVAAAVGGYRFSAAHAASMCTGGTALMDEVWNDGKRSLVRDRFLAARRPFAAQAFRQVATALDAYAGRWAAMHRQTCEATRVRGEQPETTMALRMACLEQRRRDVGALVQLFTAADAEVVESAGQAARQLPGLDLCADSATLASTKPLPEDPSARKQIDAVREEIAQVQAQVRSGKAEGAGERTQRLTARAESLGYEPLTAEAYAALGAYFVRQGKHGDAASAFKRAVWAAEQGRADETKVRALVGLAFALGELGRFEEARDYSHLAEAASSRADKSGELEVERLSTEGWIYFREGSYAEAVATLRRAAGVAEHMSDPNPEILGLVYNRLAASLLHLRGEEEALSLLRKEDQLIVAVNGEQHPARFHNLVDTSAVLLDARRFSDASQLLRRALAIAEDAGMAGLPATVVAINNLGESEDGLGRHTDGLAHFDEALGIAEKAYGERHWMAGVLRVNRARALLGLGRAKDAMVEAESGLRVVEETLPPDHDYVGRALATVGMARLALCQPSRAIPPLTRAHGLLERRGTMEEVGQVRFALARALWGTGDSSAHVRRLALDARDSFRAVAARTRADEVERWLARPTGCAAIPSERKAL